MATHAVPGNADPAAVELRKGGEQGLWKFLGDIRVHVVALIIGLLGGVNVETCTGTKVVSIILALDVQAPCV